MNSFLEKGPKSCIKRKTHRRSQNSKVFSGKARTPSPSERGEHRPSRPPPPHSRAGNITDLAVNIFGTTDDNVQTVAILIEGTNIIVSILSSFKEFRNQGMFDMRKPAMQLCVTRNLR